MTITITMSTVGSKGSKKNLEIIRARDPDGKKVKFVAMDVVRFSMMNEVIKDGHMTNIRIFGIIERLVKSMFFKNPFLPRPIKKNISKKAENNLKVVEIPQANKPR